MKFSYAAVKQLEGKYLVQNRVTGDIYESPQQLYILVGMCLFQEYPAKEERKLLSVFMMRHRYSKFLFQRQLWLV